VCCSATASVRVMTNLDCSAAEKLSGFVRAQNVRIAREDICDRDQVLFYSRKLTSTIVLTFLVVWRSGNRHRDLTEAIKHYRCLPSQSM
jgi:hypothetical protein